MSTQNRYEIEYPPEQFMGLSGPADSDQIQLAAKAFVEQESHRQYSAVQVIGTRIEELGEEQGYPGGITLKLSVLISDDDEARALSEAAAFKQGLTIHLNDVLGLFGVPPHYGILHRV